MSTNSVMFPAAAFVGGTALGATAGVDSAKKRKKLKRMLEDKVEKSDPFGIEKMIRPPKRTDKIRRGVHDVTRGPTSRRIKQKVPRFSKPAQKMKGGDKFGRLDGGEQVDRIARGGENLNAGIMGFAGGVVGGAYAVNPGYKKRVAVESKNRRTIKANDKKLQEVGKAAYRITDVGSRAERIRQGLEGTRKVIKPAGYGAVGAGLGAGLVIAGNRNEKKHHVKRVAAQQKKIKSQQEQLQRIGKNMSVSAFGVDHGEFSKADDKYGGHGAPSAGRRVLGWGFGPIHGGIAGKKGKKARAAGNQLVGNIGGASLGGVVGTLATRGSAAGAGVGAQAGNIAGAQAAVNRNQRQGYYKPQKKKS